MGRVMGPFLLLRFLLLPAPLALINPAFYFAALANLALSDVVSNLHSFIIISTNHVGSDLYRFERSVTPKSGSFYMRAVTSSANFRTANGVREDGAARDGPGPHCRQTGLRGAATDVFDERFEPALLRTAAGRCQAAF